MKTPSKQLFATFAKLAKSMGEDASAKDVHKLRTTARRIEALAAYLPPNVSENHGSALAEVRAIRKKSGKVRDLDVQLGLLHEVGNGAQRPQYEVLENRLLGKRERRSQKLHKEVRTLRRKKWLNRLEDLSAEVSGGTAKKKGDALRSAKEQLAILAARYPDSVSMVDPEELHRLRIELKRIRYTAELEGKDAVTKRFTTALEKTQDAIGEWHDWLTLSESAEEILNNYVSSGILMQLRSLTTSAFSAAIQAVAGLFSSVGAPAKKSPRAVPASARQARGNRRTA